MIEIIYRIKAWWHGKCLSPTEEQWQKGFVVEDITHYPLSRRVLKCIFILLPKTIFAFWLRHWKTLAIIIVMLISIAVTIFVHYDSKRSTTQKGKKGADTFIQNFTQSSITRFLLKICRNDKRDCHIVPKAFGTLRNDRKEIFKRAAARAAPTMFPTDTHQLKQAVVGERTTDCFSCLEELNVLTLCTHCTIYKT
ncbi:hypothetical protein KAW08_06900 [bacterium]|nr:hypothetical protein [bacterium]